MAHHMLTANSRDSSPGSPATPQSPKDIKSAWYLISTAFRSSSVLSPLIVISQVAHLLATNTWKRTGPTEEWKHVSGASPTWREKMGFALEPTDFITPSPLPSYWPIPLYLKLILNLSLAFSLVTHVCIKCKTGGSAIQRRRGDAVR